MYIVICVSGIVSLKDADHCRYVVNHLAFFVKYIHIGCVEPGYIEIELVHTNIFYIN